MEEEEEEGPSDRPSVAMGERVGGRREAPSSSFCPCIGMEGAPPVPSRAEEEATENSGGGEGKKELVGGRRNKKKIVFFSRFLNDAPPCFNLPTADWRHDFWRHLISLVFLSLLFD